MADARLVVTVPTATTHDKSHVTYSVSVKTGNTAWVVHRRYQDFEKLHAAVRR